MEKGKSMPSKPYPYLLPLYMLLFVVISASVLAQTLSRISAVRAATLIWPEDGTGTGGENVLTIQLLLLAHNDAVQLNGIFDDALASAVQTFQAASHLASSGVVDQATWPLLLLSISKGDRGTAVVALQRQLAAHGANLVPSGEFNTQTLDALHSYQQSKGLPLSSSADVQTWNKLLMTPATTQLALPPPFADGPTLWGVDTAPPVTQSSLNQIEKKFGRPDFVGKYLDGTDFTPLSADEAALIHAQDMRIMVLEADFGHDSGYSNGVYIALRAVTRARELGIPPGVAIFADLEPGSKVDASWLVAWYSVMVDAGYVAGYYANPYADRNFNAPFCSAVSRFPAIASDTILDIYQPMLTRSSAAHAPLFTPSIPYCGANPTGNVLVWQYGLSGGDREANVDTDELKASVPLW